MSLGSAAVLVNRYRLERRLASGTLSEVWHATDLELARPVAIKVLDAEVGQDAAALDQFRTVSSRASSLVHEGIVQIFDYSEPASADSPYGPFLVMELVEGPSVAEILSAGPLDAERSLDIVAQVAATLDVIHHAGLVHGDIKPQHLLMTHDRIVKLVDLVPAARTDPAATTTAAEPADDLYALGITARQCLSGHLDGADISLAALPDGVRAPVAELIQDLTATDPAARPANAGQVAARARRLRDQLAPPVASTARAAVPEPRNPPTPKAPIHQLPNLTSLMPAEIGVPEARIAKVRAVGVPVRARGRLPMSTRVSAGILLALAALTGYAYLKPASLPQADRLSHVSMVTVKASDLTGMPVSAARLRLERLGLVVHVRWQTTTLTGPGRVISVSPAGRVPVGSVITLIGSLPMTPAQQSVSHARHPAHKHHTRQSVASTGSPSPTPSPSSPSPSPSATGSPTPSSSPPPSASPPPAP